eukprot:jgi/Picsp_1/2970/NSC_01194-R1_---NA---
MEQQYVGLEQMNIERVEKGLEDFQKRLAQYGKELFGEDFVSMAMRDGDAGQEKLPGMDHSSHSEKTIQSSSLFGGSSKHQGRATTVGAAPKVNDGAKAVLLRFLEDRDELLKLRLVNKSAQDRLKQRADALEGKARRLQSMLEESEKRSKVDAMNKQAFLTELRKKMCSIERRQSRLLAMNRMPDDDYRDTVLERHKVLEEKESKIVVEDVTGFHEHDKGEPNTAFQSSLHQISEELKQLEMCMGSIDAK